MAQKRQQFLHDVWHGGKAGSLSAQSEARAWALREVWRADKKSEHGLLPFVRERVTKVGGGRPTKPTVFQLF